MAAQGDQGLAGSARPRSAPTDRRRRWPAGCRPGSMRRRRPSRCGPGGWRSPIRSPRPRCGGSQSAPHDASRVPSGLQATSMTLSDALRRRSPGRSESQSRISISWSRATARRWPSGAPCEASRHHVSGTIRVIGGRDERADRSVRDAVPNSHLAAEPRGRQPGAVGGPGDVRPLRPVDRAIDGSQPLPQGGDLLAGECVPEMDHAVDADGGQANPVGVPGHGVDQPVMPLQRLEGPRRGVPDVDRAVPPPRRRARPLRGDPHGGTRRRRGRSGGSRRSPTSRRPGRRRGSPRSRRSAWRGCGPSGPQQTHSGGTSYLKIASPAPSFGSQSLTTPSSPAEASRDPSGLNSRSRTKWV